MTGLQKVKTGTNQTSWKFYIEGRDHWLETELETEEPGSLYGPDGKTVAYKFKKYEKVQILNTHLEDVEGRRLAKVRINGIVGWTLIKNITKPTTLLKRTAGGGKVQEIQEFLVIDAINESVAANGNAPISVKAGSLIVNDVIGCRKNEGLNFYGKEKYADLILTFKNRMEKGVSMKEKRAPSLFGGGLRTMFDTNSTYIRKASQKALSAALKSPLFELGSNKKIADIFILFRNKKFIQDLLEGTEKVGGPVEFLFIGPKQPRYKFEKGLLTFTDGDWYTTKQYAQHANQFYLRIRRRDTTQVFTNEIDKDGIPLFFKRPGGRERARFVVDKIVSGRGLVVDGDA